MKVTTVLKKLTSQYLDNYSVKYELDSHDFNTYLGKKITIIPTKKIQCTSCKKWIKKCFRMGCCYTCFFSSPITSPCVLSPEKCQAHLGVGRDMEWEKKYHLTPQIVYLSYTSHVKVGVTQQANIPYRWIDQGALNAIILCETPNRYIAGCIEVALKKHFYDKTFWKKMLLCHDPVEDLQDKKADALKHLTQFEHYFSSNNTHYKFIYPFLEYPNHISSSVNLDKCDSFSGRLTGIKGQYLFFESGDVLNINKYIGYEVTFSF